MSQDPQAGAVPAATLARSERAERNCAHVRDLITARLPALAAAVAVVASEFENKET